MEKEKKSLKQRLLNEFGEYFMNFIYMALFFSAVIFYRRHILAQYDIVLNDYFFGVIKALVIAKVVMIGAFLRISHKFEDKALIVPIIYKSLLFVVWVMLFDIAEVFIVGLINNPNISEVYFEIKERVSMVWLASIILIFLSFIPFFAFKELARLIGKEKIKNLFFKKNSRFKT